MVIISGTKLKRAVTRMNMNYKLPEGMKTYIPGRSEERRRDYVRRLKWKKQESKIPHRIWVEIIYAAVLCLCAGVGMIYFCLALTLLGWRQSIQSITVNVTVPNPDYPDDRGRDREYTMLQGDGMNTHVFSLVYFFNAFYLYSISFMALWYAAFLGQRRWYFYTFFNHAACLIVEAVTNAISFYLYPRHGCDSRLFRKYLKEYFKWYGILGIHQHNFGHEAMDKISMMQGYMGCCGVDNWTDYKYLAKLENGGRLDWWPREIRYMEGEPANDLLHYLSEGRELDEVPHTCCTTTWMHNIYCAEDVFAIDAKYGEDHPIARSRFSPSGCVAATEVVCEQLVKTLTWGCLYLLIFRILSFISFFILTYFIFEGNKDLSQTLFLLTEGFQGRKFVSNVKGPEDLNLDLVRHHDDRFKEGETNWVPPEQTARGVPKRRRSGASMGSRRSTGNDWTYSGGNLVAEGQEPDWQSVVRVQNKLSKQSVEKHKGALYFGEEYDPSLTEEETYQKIEAGREVKSKKQLIEELHQRKKGRRRKAKGKRKGNVEAGVVDLIQSKIADKEVKPEQKPEPHPTSIHRPHAHRRSTVASHRRSTVTSHHNLSKLPSDPHLDKLESLEDLAIDIPPLDRFLLEEQRRLVKEREIQELIKNKAKKKQLEASGNKVPEYLLHLPPTPPDADLLYAADDEDEDLVLDILETKGHKTQRKRGAHTAATSDKVTMLRATLNLPKHIEDKRYHHHLREGKH